MIKVTAFSIGLLSSGSDTLDNHRSRINKQFARKMRCRRITPASTNDSPLSSLDRLINMNDYGKKGDEIVHLTERSHKKLAHTMLCRLVSIRDEITSGHKQILYG